VIKRTLTVAAMAAVVATGASSAAQARDQISIVGSSTVYPFATKVAERFGRTTEYPTPKVESTGSGGGLQLFCQGVGVQHPDITNASRAIKDSEIEKCHNNGVENITEVRVGFDGIVMANADGAPELDLTRKEIFLALAKMVPKSGDSSKLVENPNDTWSDVSSDLPDQEIHVLGPPPTSGTRDAFAELVLAHGCEQFPGIEHSAEVCHAVREDGAYVEAGENDTVIVQKLRKNHDAVGIFGFSFLDQNRGSIKGAAINGYKPTFKNIANKDYPVARPLFFYIKDAHVGMVPGIMDYVAEFTSRRAAGPNGYLTNIGLIPQSPKALEKVREEAMNLADNLSK